VPRRPPFLIGLLIIALIAAIGGGVHERLARPSAPRPTGLPIAGRAHVVDGDSLEVAGHRIRLFGIDAPDGAQGCRDERGISYACGRQAAGALQAKIGARTVACDPRGVDRRDRIPAVCRLGSEELNAWMVRQGWAVAARDEGHDYVRAEAQAKSERLGLWAGEFMSPADWRRAR
jgi:endonuclease YncB( thermonuclease family)